MGKLFVNLVILFCFRLSSTKNYFFNSQVPSTSFSSHGALKKHAVEPPSEATNSNRGQVRKNAPSSRWISPLMRISSTK